MKSLVALGVLALSSASCLAAADRVGVTVVNRQDSEQSYSYATAFGSAYSANAAGATFSLSGATLTLQLADGRTAVVNCVYKFAEHMAGPIGNRRSCRVPLVDHFQAEFHGDNAKLFWPVSLDGKKIQSETYKIIAVK
jgi:hypothetical protein